MTEPAYDIPDYPERDDPAFRTVTIVEKEASKTSSIRMIMGTLDDTHFHGFTRASLATATTPRHRTTRSGAMVAT